MSKMSELDQDLQTIREIMADPVLSAEEQIERKCDAIIRELDEFMAMAANGETVDLIEGQKLSFGQMQTRVQLILSFLAARKAPKLKMIKNDFFRPEDYAHA